MSTISMFGTCQACGLVQYMQGQPCRDCGGSVEQGGKRAEKVVALPGAPVPGYQAVPETVEILRGMLALAERGEVRSLALAYTDADRKVVTNWHNNGEYFLMIGGVAWLQQRMLEGSNTD